ncbi:HMCN1 protein, partial [Cercotrichas coryphoeus]|nr:HMCN1 protein [Cercotrichas coryphoeus]
EDAGTYMCVAQNPAGTALGKIKLKVQVPPVIKSHVEEYVVAADQSVTLQCEAEGYPGPEISWHKDGQRITESMRSRVLSTGALQLLFVQPEDSGRYTCTAANPAGSSTSSTELAVHGGPARAKGSIIGNINDVEFGIAFLNATVTDSPDSDTRVIQAKITNVPRTLGPAMRKLVSILSPVYWTTAKEIGEAMNGFTLTDAVFKRETQVEFATGEILRMTHVARGLDADGALLLDVVVSGHMLQLQSQLMARVLLQDYTEDYIQTGPGQLHAHSTRLFAADGVSVPYTWNHTITYDSSKGRMPFLVQTLRAASITAQYNPLEEAVAFKIHASIAKGIVLGLPRNPAVLVLLSADIDECESRDTCQHECRNSLGSFQCVCPAGYRL